MIGKVVGSIGVVTCWTGVCIAHQGWRDSQVEKYGYYNGLGDDVCKESKSTSRFDCECPAYDPERVCRIRSNSSWSALKSILAGLLLRPLPRDWSKDPSFNSKWSLIGELDKGAESSRSSSLSFSN